MLSLPFFNFSRFIPQFSQLPRFLQTRRSSIDKKKSQKKLHPVLPSVTFKEEVLRNVFVKNLIKHNQLRAFLPSGEILTVYALAYDRINSQLIVSDQAEQGLLYLEEGDKVEFYTDLNETHEYFSFVSKVIKIKVKGIKLTYYMSVPRVLKKSRRRVIPRIEVNNHSIIRIAGSHFSGRVVDLSVNGISFDIHGYYPEPLVIGEDLKDCYIDIFQPRINDNISFNCSINIRRFDYQSKPERLTTIAGIYTNQDIEQEKKIFSYLSENKVYS
ncbi:MAG: PilZ domain-containing protein [Pseudomonadota bacterium]